jgi:non-ribosomal peptide synthetase component F
MPASENMRFKIANSDVEALRALAARERTTLFVVLVSLYFCTLHLASGRGNIAVGLVIANRPRKELFDTVGPFANFAVLAAQWPADPCFADVLTAVRRSMLEVLAHQEYPYLNMRIDPAMNNSAARAAGTVFNMLAVPTKVAPQDGIEFKGLSTQTLPIPPGMGSRFDLELLIDPKGDGFHGEYRYAPDRYDKRFIDGLTERYTRLIRHVLDHPADPLTAMAG